MAKVSKLHLHDVNPHVTRDDDGQRIVETLCVQYYPASKVVSVAHYKEWVESRRYTAEIFCAHCREALANPP